MDLKHLLSIVIAALTALAAILYSMGAQHALAAVALWMAAIFSLVATDFLGVLRLPRAAGSFLMWCVLVVYVVRFLATWDSRIFAGHSPDWQLQNVVNVLMFLQCVLLFQEKDAKAYGWLTVMSLLQVVVAARYSRGVTFGSLLIVYTVAGMFALALLALYAQRGGTDQRTCFAPRDERDRARRWPLAGADAEFSSAPLGGGRAGIVPDFLPGYRCSLAPACYWRPSFSTRCRVRGFLTCDGAIVGNRSPWSASTTRFPLARWAIRWKAARKSCGCNSSMPARGSPTHWRNTRSTYAERRQIGIPEPVGPPAAVGLSRRRFAGSRAGSAVSAR